MMRLCNDTVTLIKHDKTQKGDTYQCTVIVGASWHAKTAVKLENGGVAAANVIKVRIPEENIPEGLRLHAGDYVAHGIVSNMEKLSDLKGTEYMKVMTVSDNRRGLMRHWAVTGA